MRRTERVKWKNEWTFYDSVDHILTQTNKYLFVVLLYFLYTKTYIKSKKVCWTTIVVQVFVEKEGKNNKHLIDFVWVNLEVQKWWEVKKMGRKKNLCGRNDSLNSFLMWRCIKKRDSDEEFWIWSTEYTKMNRLYKNRDNMSCQMVLETYDILRSRVFLLSFQSVVVNTTFFYLLSLFLVIEYPLEINFP